VRYGIRIKIILALGFFSEHKGSQIVNLMIAFFIYTLVISHRNPSLHFGQHNGLRPVTESDK